MNYHSTHKQLTLYKAKLSCFDKSILKFKKTMNKFQMKYENNFKNYRCSVKLSA